ncbi:MAG: hypothetical protein Q4G25_05920 [Paracoccus sp. (in: a-proteobacteria)]|nr:hypothetical protein [Paracoccus sp. (in: a-proteobacteria)]
MTKPAPRWADNPKLPIGVNLYKALALFVVLQCFGPAAWSAMIVGLASGWQGRGFLMFLVLWMAPLVPAAVILALALLRATPICRLISTTGYLFLRSFIVGFCVLGIGLAYGSSSFFPCVWATIIGIAGIEIYAWLNIRQMSDQKIIKQMKGAFSDIDESGRFQLLTHGPGLSEDEMWLKGGVQFRLFSALALLSPFLFALAVTGRGDAMAGPIMVAIGLVIYFLAVGTWAGHYALRRAIKLRLAGSF